MIKAVTNFPALSVLLLTIDCSFITLLRRSFFIRKQLITIEQTKGIVKSVPWIALATFALVAILAMVADVNAASQIRALVMHIKRLLCVLYPSAVLFRVKYLSKLRQNKQYTPICAPARLGIL